MICLKIFWFAIFFVTVKSCDDSIATFYLTTLNKYDDLKLTDENLSKVNKKLDTIFLIHGWNDDKNQDYYAYTKESYRARGIPINFIAVDWSKLSSDNYITAALSGISKASNCVGNFVVKLKKLGIKLSKVQLIGISLGAHVAGCAGKYIYNNTTQKVARVTVLDPAGPLFNALPYVGLTCSAASTDGVVVDAIHTNIGVFGIFRDVGSVNFYANGGIYQPGCLDVPITQLLKLDTITCSHKRSIVYYNESINSQRFVCHDSNPPIIYGQNLTPGATGAYNFKTNSESPYALG